MMKQNLLIFLVCLLCSGSALQMEAQSLQTDMDTVSYCVGMMVAQSVKAQVGDIRYEAFMEGFRHQMEEEGLLLTTTQAQEYLNAYGEMQRRAQFEKQIAEGEAFLSDNAQKEGIVVLDNGLQYEVLVPGPEDAPKPGLKDRVKVHYHGTLISGEVFDSSVDRGEPATFGVSGVIKGWTEILQMMQVGSKWKVYIPADLAYGARGSGKIKPYTTLIFEIELLEIL